MIQVVMAKGRFTKGDPRINKGGKPRLTPEQKAIRDSYPSELAKILKEAQYLSIPDIVEKSKDPHLPVLYRGLYKTMQKYIETGDYQRYMEPIINRIIGKPKETYDVTALPKPVIIERLDGIREVLGYELEDKLIEHKEDLSENNS